MRKFGTEEQFRIDQNIIIKIMVRDPFFNCLAQKGKSNKQKDWKNRENWKILISIIYLE